MPPSMIPALKLYVTLLPSSTIDLGPSGRDGPTRICSGLSSGHLTSLDPACPLHATVLPGGSDWLLSEASTDPPTAHLNVRVTARTESQQGASSATQASLKPDQAVEAVEAIAISYQGILRVDELAQKALMGAQGARTTKRDEHYWFVNMVFEVSSQRLKWMEQSVFVGQGRFVVGKSGVGIEYEISRLVPSAS